MQRVSQMEGFVEVTSTSPSFIAGDPRLRGEGPSLPPVMPQVMAEPKTESVRP